MFLFLKAIKSKLQLSRDIIRRKIGIYLFDYSKKTTTIDDIKSIVIVRWDAKYGDAIVSSWIFRELKKTHPNLHISVITTPGMAWLFRDYFGADFVYETPKRPSYYQLFKLSKELTEVDLVIHFSKYLKLKDLFFLRNINARHVASLDDAISLVDIKLGESTKNLHFREKFLALTSLLGITSPDMTYIIPAILSCEAGVEKFWPKNRDILCFNPYGSNNSRRLDAQSIERILSFLSREFPNLLCCVIYAPSDKKEVEQICSRYSETAIYYKNSTHIGDAIAQMRRSKAVLSVDTATVHIANGLGKPLFAIYNGEQENLEWYSTGTMDHSIYAILSYPPDINLISFEQFEVEFRDWWKKIE